MSLMSGQGLKVVGATVLFGLLIISAMPTWAGKKPDALSEQEQTARIQELQRDRVKVEGELRQIRSQLEGTARSTVPRSDFSDQPTRSMKESLESVPGVSVRQGSSGRDISLSIRGSK